MKIIKKNNLLKFTTFKIGGPADLLTIAETENELISAIKYASKKNIPWIVLGKGSNVLISDKGFRGLVILNQIKDFLLNKNILTIGSGHGLVAMVNKLMKAGYGGFEGLAGIPGTIGGAIIGNAGAWGYEISDNLITVEIYDFKKDRVMNLKKDKINFNYRKSDLDNVIILSAKFKIKKENPEKIQKKITEFTKKRIEKQPSGFSCGSFFKNPEGYSAGELIEKTGLKGLRVGGAIVSNKHANFIINDKDAKAIDIYNLSKEIKDKVYKKFKIKLEEEVKYIGFN